MASAIDPTKPPDDAPASKSDLRANLQAAKNEIEALQRRRVLDQAGDVTIAALTEQSSPSGSDKVAIEQVDGSFRSVALDSLSAMSGARVEGIIDVKAAPFKAVGDGSADDTAAIQAAIDAAVDGGVVYLPSGGYSIDCLKIPHDRAIKVQGVSPWASTLIGRTAGEDIFRITDPGGAKVQDRFRTVHVYDNLGFVLNTGKAGADLADGLDRCTTAGLAVGPCCIAYVTDFVPSATGDPGIDTAWLHSFGVVSHCVVNVSRKHDGHGCGFIHHGANHYGWTYRDIRIDGAHYGITDSLPWVRRVAVLPASDRLTVLHGANPFRNGQTLFVAAHAATGRLPSGLRRFQPYHVVDGDSTGFRLAAAVGDDPISLGSDGSGAIYVHGADAFAGEYAPDGISIDRLTHYGGRCPISLTNTENLHIGRVDSYGAIAALHLHGARSLNRKEHIGPVIEAFYSESPETAAMPPGEDLVHVNAMAGSIGYLQLRGERAGGTRPPVRFAGRGYRVNSLDLVSSRSQAQPDIMIDGDQIGLFGRAHRGCTLIDKGNGNYYLLAGHDGGWAFRSESPFA